MEWESGLKRLSKKLGQKGQKGLVREIRNRWFFQRRAQSLKPLDVAGMSLKRFSALFPDAKAWSVRLASKSNRTVPGLWKATGYKGDPLLFSMFACLFSEPGLKAVSASSINKKRGALIKAAGDYRNQHGFNPHPAVLIKECL
jgi:hypothetical protein